MTEEQKKLFLEQRAGFELLAEFETQKLRRMTFEDRVKAFRRIQGFTTLLPKNDDRSDDDEVTRTWQTIRERYDASRR